MKYALIFFGWTAIAALMLWCANKISEIKPERDLTKLSRTQRMLWLSCDKIKNQGNWNLK